MLDKTEILTAKEIAFKQRAPIFNDLQRVTLAASLRTGKRYGTQVSAGKFDVVLTKYALDKAGNTKGVADVEVVMPRCSVNEAIDYLEGIV